MIHITKAVGKKRYRYTGSKKYRENKHQKVCKKTKEMNERLLQRLEIQNEPVELKDFTEVIKKIYKTCPVEKQDAMINKILKARLLLGE